MRMTSKLLAVLGMFSIVHASEGGFQGHVDGNTLPVGTESMKVEVYNYDDELVGSSSTFFDPVFRFSYGLIALEDVHEGPYDLVCLAYDHDSEVIAENWLYNVVYTGTEYYQVEDFWWGSE